MQPYDTSGDGIADAWVSDGDGDGRIETVGFDNNQDGVYDGVALDQNADGYFETVGVDRNQDGVYEELAVNGQVAVDSNGDGAADSWTTSPSSSTSYEPSGIVGGAPTYDGADGLLLDIAAETGTATYGAPDSDFDGYNDDVDHRPNDDDYY